MYDPAWIFVNNFFNFSSLEFYATHYGAKGDEIKFYENI
jgi:hypothetical protein